MPKDQNVIITTSMSDGTISNVGCTIPAGHNGKHGLTRETTLLKWDLNQPDGPGLFACGRMPDNGGGISGMYIRMRDYLDTMTRTNIIVTYAMLDIPMWLGRTSCAQIDYSDPQVEEDTGRIYCDVQMTGYLIFTQYVTIGKNNMDTTYRPAGTIGAVNTGIPVSDDPEKLDCLRFYRSILY